MTFGEACHDGFEFVVSGVFRSNLFCVVDLKPGEVTGIDAAVAVGVKFEVVVVAALLAPQKLRVPVDLDDARERVCRHRRRPLPLG